MIDGQLDNQGNDIVQKQSTFVDGVIQKTIKVDQLTAEPGHS